MKRLTSALAIGLLLTVVASVQAADFSPADVRIRETISVGEVTPTPEMWFYQQAMNQYEDPKMAVRAKAEERSAQRRARLAALKWFGFSNSRPRAGVDPFHGDYSPTWTARNMNYPFRWSGYGPAMVVVRPVVSTRVY